MTEYWPSTSQHIFYQDKRRHLHFTHVFTRITQNVHLFNAFHVISFKCPIGGREVKYNELTAEACALFFHPEFKFIIDPKKKNTFLTFKLVCHIKWISNSTQFYEKEFLCNIVSNTLNIYVHSLEDHQNLHTIPNDIRTSIFNSHILIQNINAKILYTLNS